MADEERRPLFTSEVANSLAPMKVDREPLYQTPTRKGKTKTMWVGSPMHVDGDDAVRKERKWSRKSFSDLFGSPMKGVVEGGGLPRKPLPRPRFSKRAAGS